jgi:hypothetical protein
MATATPNETRTITITHHDQPSRSKGWARYRLTAAGRPVIYSQTGNEWLAFGSGSTLVKPRTCAVANGARLRLEVEVQLREGRAARATTYTHTVTLSADGGDSRIRFRPGSQGAELSIAGASEEPAEASR